MRFLSIHNIELPYIYTLIPAVRHLLTASGTLGRGGSIMENNPTKHNPSMGKFTCKVIDDEITLGYL